MGRDVFADRREAGCALAAALVRLAVPDPVVLALPRGGVPVAFEVARALAAPLDVLLVRKIGAPGHEEYGIGAVVDGVPPQLVLDEAAAQRVGADRAYVDRQLAREIAEIERRRAAYGAGSAPSLAGRGVIVVDDGVATGGTARAALQALARMGCARVVLAVPVGAADSLAALAPLCDEVVCLASPEPFHAVGAHYRDFTQTSDAEVVRLLAEADGGANAGANARVSR